MMSLDIDQGWRDLLKPIWAEAEYWEAEPSIGMACIYYLARCSKGDVGHLAFLGDARCKRFLEELQFWSKQGTQNFSMIAIGPAQCIRAVLPFEYISLVCRLRD